MMKPQILFYTGSGILAIGLSMYFLGSYSGYKRGKAEMEQMYQTQAKTLSETLSDTLQKGFEKYQTKLDQSQEIQNEKLKQTLQEYRDLGQCHTPNGIGMLNQQILKRGNQNTKSTP